MLKDLSLSTLAETKLQGQFLEALGIVNKSLEKEGDISGVRTISIKLAFTPNERGYINVDMSCNANVPGRRVLTIAALEDKTLRIDTLSNDAQQPSLLERAIEEKKVIKLNQKEVAQQ